MKHDWVRDEDGDIDVCHEVVCKHCERDWAVRRRPGMTTLDELWAELGIDPDRVSSCQYCGHVDTRDYAVPWRVLPCGYCEAYLCPNCKKIQAAVGPVFADGSHDMHGMYGHMTWAEQPMLPFPKKGRS